MSAAAAPRACAMYPRAVRYRNERQARAGRDRTRARQQAAGVPFALCLADWYRCGTCRGWHLRANAESVRRFFHDLHASGAQAYRLLDAAA